MKFKVQYHEFVVKNDIPKLSSAHKKRIKKDIEDKLMSSPEIFGKPLRRSLKGYRKLRSGDFRIVFKIDGDFVKILIIQHRSVVYKQAENRM